MPLPLLRPRLTPIGAQDRFVQQEQVAQMLGGNPANPVIQHIRKTPGPLDLLIDFFKSMSPPNFDPNRPAQSLGEAIAMSEAARGSIVPGVRNPFPEIDPLSYSTGTLNLLRGGSGALKRFKPEQTESAVTTTQPKPVLIRSTPTGYADDLLYLEFDAGAGPAPKLGELRDYIASSGYKATVSELAGSPFADFRNTKRFRIDLQDRKSASELAQKFGGHFSSTPSKLKE